MGLELLEVRGYFFFFFKKSKTNWYRVKCWGNMY